MLDAFIIKELKEELKRKERQRERDAEQPRLPVPGGPGLEEEADWTRQSDDSKPQRGVVIIDYSM